MMDRERLEAILARSRFPTWKWNIPSDRVAFNDRKARMLVCRLEDFRGIVTDLGSRRITHRGARTSQAPCPGFPSRPRV